MSPCRKNLCIQGEINRFEGIRFFTWPSMFCISFEEGIAIENKFMTDRLTSNGSGFWKASKSRGLSDIYTTKKTRSLIMAGKPSLKVICDEVAFCTIKKFFTLLSSH